MLDAYHCLEWLRMLLFVTVAAIAVLVKDVQVGDKEKQGEERTCGRRQASGNQAGAGTTPGANRAHVIV